MRITKLSTLRTDRLVRKWHSDQIKVKAVKLYLETGNLATVADKLKISYHVVRHWKYKTDWWDKVVQELRNEYDQFKDGKIEQLVHKSYDALGDRLDNGDYILDSRSGEVKRIPMKGKEIASVAKSLHQQQKDLRNAPVMAQQAQATKEMLVDLAKQFAQLAKPKKEKEIEGEVIESITVDSGDN